MKALRVKRHMSGRDANICGLKEIRSHEPYDGVPECWVGATQRHVFHQTVLNAKVYNKICILRRKAPNQFRE